MDEHLWVGRRNFVLGPAPRIRSGAGNDQEMDDATWEAPVIGGASIAPSIASWGSQTTTLPEVDTETVEETSFEPIYRVLLHDDDVHDMGFVADCLVRVFAIQRTDAWAIMSEAHCTGVALCCCEPRPDAERHRDKLRSYGLSATIEPDG